MSSVHRASLVDPALHSPELLEIIKHKLDQSIIKHLVRVTINAVGLAMRRVSTSDHGRGQARTRNPRKNAAFTQFVTNVIRQSQTKLPAVLVALVYIERVRPNLSISLEQWACERMFLGALVVASKYINDITLKNIQWATCTGIFGKRDIGRVEREFLNVLDWELSVQETDILAYYDVVCPSASSSRHQEPPQPTKRRRSPEIKQVLRWTDRDDSYSTASSSPSPQTPFEIVKSPLRSPAFQIYEVERSLKRPRSIDVPPPVSILHASSPSRRYSILNAFVVLRSIPIHVHWPTGDRSQRQCSTSSTSDSDQGTKSEEM